MERIFEQPTPEEIEARRKMYDEAEKLGIDLMAYDETMEELRFTEAELKELEKARSMPIVFDADCPETTPERALKFRRVNPSRSGMGKRA